MNKIFFILGEPPTGLRTSKISSREPNLKISTWDIQKKTTSVISPYIESTGTSAFESFIKINTIYEMGLYLKKYNDNSNIIFCILPFTQDDYMAYSPDFYVWSKMVGIIKDMQETFKGNYELGEIFAFIETTPQLKTVVEWTQSIAKKYPTLSGKPWSFISTKTHINRHTDTVLLNYISPSDTNEYSLDSFFGMISRYITLRHNKKNIYPLFQIDYFLLGTYGVAGIMIIFLLFAFFISLSKLI